MKRSPFLLITVFGVVVMTLAGGAWAQFGGYSNQGGPDSFLSVYTTPNAPGIKIGGTVAADFVETIQGINCKSMTMISPVQIYTANVAIRVTQNNAIYPFAFSIDGVCEVDVDWLMSEGLNKFVNTVVLNRLYPGAKWVNNPPAVLKWTGNVTQNPNTYPDGLICYECTGEVGFVMFDFEYAVK